MEVGTVAAWIQLAIWAVVVAIGVIKFIESWKTKGFAQAIRLPKRILYALAIVGLLVSAASLYLNYRPRIVQVEKIVEKPVDRVVEKIVPSECPKCQNPAGNGKKSTGKNNTPRNGTQAAGDNSTAIGTVTQGPCSVLQSGGNNNQAQGGNCAPPLTLTPSLSVVPSDQEGFIKTIIRVVPNVDVATTGSVVMKFDNPVKSVGFWIEGSAGVMGGGRSVPSGTDPVVTISSGFNPKHPLLLTVYSALPVKLLEIHLE